MLFRRLRSWLRTHFTRLIDDESLPCIQDTTRDKPKIRRRRRSVPPSERFVWAMLILIVALIGLIAIEVAYVAVTGQISTEILLVISGLVGALASRFLENKR